MLREYLERDRIEAGCDEAGRGCLAGPVFAAAVIWPAGLQIEGLDDSKKLSSVKRNELRQFIEKNVSDYAVASVDQDEIEEINILNASFLAMHRALNKLESNFQHLIIDGNRFNPYKKLPYTTIIGGDGKFASIAAASILAKTYRDEYMEKIHQEFPEYGWLTNMGYATEKHRDAIKKYGLTEHHRPKFCQRILNEQGKLF